MSSVEPHIEVGANAADRERNARMGVGVVDDPHPRLDELRASGPVHAHTIAEGFGIDGPEAIGWPGRACFSCYDWESVEQVLRDGETFSSSWYDPTLRPTVGVSLLQLDGAAHRRYRELIQPSFIRSQIERWGERWIQPTVDRILGELLARGGPADLYAELCAHVPVATIASAFGVEGDDFGRFHELAIRSLGGVGSPDPGAALAAAQEMGAELRAIVADRRARPRDDLISVLCGAEMRNEEGGGTHVLDDEEILSFARIMIPAGAGTTYRGLGSLLLGLLQTDQLERVRHERHRLDDAIEEALRWEPPLTSLTRIAMRDTELAGIAIPEGSIVSASLSAANRDPARWDDPHRFDIARERQVHTTFGLGPHLCVGMHLARLELRTAMNGVLDRLPGLRLDPDAATPHMTGLFFRMPTAVPVVFDA